MTLREELARCGLEVHGDPPVVRVTVVGDALDVQVREEADRVVLAAGRPVAAPGPPGELVGATLAGRGDTSFAVEGSTVVGRRSLVAPPLGQLYDGIHELAKAVVGVADLLETAAQSQAESDLGAPAASLPPAAPMPPAAPTPPPSPPVGVPAAPRPAQPQPERWCYVTVPTDVRDLRDTNRVAARLVPGSWYRLLEESGDWARVADTGRTFEGWVPRAGLGIQ